MKKTQIKDALRTIKSQKVSYISIVVIAFLAITCYVGVSCAAYSLEMGGTNYYEALNFRDLEVASSVLFTEEDLEAIRQIDGVKDAEGQLFTSALVKGESDEHTVKVLSLTERINLPLLKEGALPSQAGECIIETNFANISGLRPGDKVTLTEASGSLGILAREEFTVTGIFEHPDRLANSYSSGFYVMVTKDAFDSETLQGRMIYAQVTVDKPAGINRMSDTYFSRVNKVEAALDQVSVERAAKTLTEMWEQLETAKENFTEAYVVPAARAVLSFLPNMTEEKIEEYINKGREAAQTKLDLTDPEMNARIISIVPGNALAVPDKDALPEFAETVINLIVDELNNLSGLGLDKLSLTEAQKANIKESLEKVDLSAYDKLLTAADMWNTGHARYLITLAKVNGTAANPDELGVWIPMNAKMNAGYAHLAATASGINSLAFRFTMLFVVIAAIVIYATVGKLITEQRKLLGTTKAFGFYKREIFGKYLIFGMSATLLGTVLGFLGGVFGLQFFAVYSYGRMYVFGTPPLRVIAWELVVIPLLGLLITFLAVWLASSKLLKAPAVELMKDAVPEGRKKAQKRAGRSSLYNKLIVRNMLSDLKRVTVTVVSIAGCCTLILIGLSIYTSIKKTVSYQFDKVIRFDSYIMLDEDKSGEAIEEITKVLDAENCQYIPARTDTGAIRLGGATEPADLIVADLPALSDLFTLRYKNSKPFTDYPDSGVLIPDPYARLNKVNAGSSCVLLDSLGNSHIAEIAGTFENYLGKNVVMSEAAYTKMTGKALKYNTLLVRHTGIDREALGEKLRNIDGYNSIARSDDIRVMYDGFSDLMAIMVLILVVAAALMSGVILTNLVNIYILQKKRELTIMRVNGFTTKEVKNYVSREALLTTLIGVIIGTVAGFGMVQLIMPALSKSFAWFMLTPQFLPALIAWIMTALFTVVIYRIALRKVKDLKLSDIA